MSITSEKKRRKLKKLQERDGNLCHYCGVELQENDIPHVYKPDGISIDHIVPQIRGGTDDLSNLVLACRRCNSQKKTKDYHEFRLIKETEQMLRFIMDGEL